MEEQHLQNENFSRTEKESRVESLPSPNSKKFEFEEVIYVGAFAFELRIFLERRHFAIDADILSSRHFAMDADILP